MDNKLVLRAAIVVALSCASLGAQQPPLNSVEFYERVKAMGDSERVAMAKLIMDKGVPVGEPNTILQPLGLLAEWHSSLILPVIEAKIEEILRSPNPRDAFTDKAVDVPRTEMMLSSIIASVGDQQALREASKLLKIDAKRFDDMVEATMDYAMGDGREFALAYQGFELGDPEIDKRILAVLDNLIGKEVPKVGNPIYRDATGPLSHWGEALVDRHGGMPTEAQWSADPIASHLKSDARRILHNDVMRFAADAVQERARKPRK